MELCEFLDDCCGEGWDVGFLETVWVCVGLFFSFKWYRDARK